jgi:hypothetical protein
VQQNHTAEKIKQSKTYKRQVKELNEQIVLMKRREQDKQRLEGLMKKSEDMVHRLKSDITRIKNQKSSLERQIQVRTSLILVICVGLCLQPYVSRCNK